MTVFAFIVAILPLVLEIWKEIFSAKAKADAANKQFTIDLAAILAASNAALTRLHNSLAHDSAGAGNAWDAADRSHQP